MKCYGHFGKEGDKCRSCEFSASCEYYTGAALNEGFSHADESLNAGKFNTDWHRNAARLEPGLPDVRLTLRDLADFARFLFSLDDTSLGILSEVIRGAASVSELAELAGTTRQNTHHRVVEIIHRVPELTELFSPLMPKLTAARRSFLFGRGRYGNLRKHKNKEVRK